MPSDPKELVKYKQAWAKLSILVEEAKKHPKTEPRFKPLDLKPEDDLKPGEFGLTNEEYNFLLDDIDQAIAEANEKWDYSDKMFARGQRISKMKHSRLTQFLALQRRV
jgi:hypothetical protein